MYRDTTIRAR